MRRSMVHSLLQNDLTSCTLRLELAPDLTKPAYCAVVCRKLTIAVKLWGKTKRLRMKNVTPGRLRLREAP